MLRNSMDKSSAINVVLKFIDNASSNQAQHNACAQEQCGNRTDRSLLQPNSIPHQANRSHLPGIIQADFAWTGVVVIAAKNQNLRTNHGKPLLLLFLLKMYLDLFQGLSEWKKKSWPEIYWWMMFTVLLIRLEIFWIFRIVKKSKKFWVSTKIKTVVFDSAEICLLMICFTKAYECFPYKGLFGKGTYRFR